MTERKGTEHDSTNSPSQNAALALSVLERMYRDAERRQAVAARIRQLWEESGYTESEIAEAIGVTLSGYQKQKSSGKISRESVEGLAKVHKVSPEWILTGREPGKTPDALEALRGDSELRDQLDRIEEKVDELLRRVPSPLAPPPGELAREPADDKPKPPARSPKPSGRRPGARTR